MLTGESFQGSIARSILKRFSHNMHLATFDQTWTDKQPHDVNTDLKSKMLLARLTANFKHTNCTLVYKTLYFKVFHHNLKFEMTTLYLYK